MIVRLDGLAFIRDLGSSNGTTVNGGSVESDTAIGEGAEIIIRPFKLTVRFGIRAAFQQLCDLQASTECDLDVIACTKRPPFRRPDLTPAQLRVYERLMRGMQEKEVARDLEISLHTVHTHAKAIYKALSVSSRAEMLSRKDGE